MTRVLDALAGEGVLTYRSNTAQRSGDKTERMPFPGRGGQRCGGSDRPA